MKKSGMLNRRPYRPGPSATTVTAISRVLEFLVDAPVLTSKIFTLSDLLRYKFWCQSKFGNDTLVRNKEVVWHEIAKLVSRKSQEMCVIELGVAWGYLNWWWFNNYSELIQKWDGFDRFTGLPRKWRGLAAGTFDTQGQTPKLSDERITWHVGNVEDTINVINSPSFSKLGPTHLIFFDLDIYEPSLVAWNILKSRLRIGDILYFDEAFDADEQRLLDEAVLPSGEFRYIASSWTSLAIEVVRMNDCLTSSNEKP